MMVLMVMLLLLLVLTVIVLIALLLLIAIERCLTVKSLASAVAVTHIAAIIVGAQNVAVVTATSRSSSKTLR